MDQIREFISDICKFSPRQGENEVKTARYLESCLDERKIVFSTQLFKTEIPLATHAELYLDGKKVPCLGKSFVGGKITSKSQVEFSPYSDYIETITFQSIPTVTISRTNVKILENATRVAGEVVVERLSFQSRNILVGNKLNPQKIIFAHYDGLGGGAIDNAGSVAICLQLLAENSELSSENLFVFAGNEELSYDTGDYWGKGYREFENKYTSLLESTREIIVVDGIGVTAPILLTQDLDEVFPIKKLSIYSSKIFWLSSVQSEVLKSYHCLEDTSEKLKDEFLTQSLSLLKQKLDN